MKKNILLLINGFGIEQADSINIYSPEVMPNMDRLTKERIFTSISNTCLDYKDAYRKFSMGISEPLTYSLIENNIYSVEYENNQLLKYIENETTKNNSNLHLFCYWESEKIIEQITTYVKEILSKTNCKIFIHIILCQKGLEDYKNIDRGLNTLSYELGANVKLGIITGENNMNQIVPFKEVIKGFVTEVGEKWKDVSKKVNVFYQTKVPPFMARTFMVNYGCRIEEKDQILFFNYSNVDITNFKKELEEQKYRKIDVNTIGFYSLFPVKSESQIPFMYNYAVSSTYTLDSLKKINARCLILDNKDKCANINYYLTGLRNEVTENIKYLPTDDNFIYDASKLLDTIKKYDKELYIVNYEINNCKTVEEITERLSKIDSIIGEVDKYARENNYGVFISSLYGLEKDLYNKKSELCKVNFSRKVPVIIDDNEISLSKYTLLDGSLYELSNTIIWNVNNTFDNVPSLLKKKSSLLSFLYKKPKKEVQKVEESKNE